MSEIVVRNAVAADRENVARLDASLDSAGDNLELLDLSEEQVDIIDGQGSSTGVHLLVAEKNHSIVGFAFACLRVVAGEMVDHSSSVLLLRRLAVAPTARRTGVGRALLEELQQRIAHDPRSMLQAHVPQAAADFYEAEGWTVLDPHMALAWIETPSLAVWEAAKSNGFDAGPRRKVAMLRTEDPTADAGSDYNCVAFKVLREDLIVDRFTFEYGAAPSSLFDALNVIADEITANPARRKELPPDVTKLVFEMVLVPKLGLEAANKLRRG